MSNKFNANALAEYCRAFARRLCNEAYQNQPVMNGRELLDLAPVAQINLLIISSLYDKWKADAEKFRSPYFDFTHSDVQEALQGFMNTVSQHIAIRREHLEPLLIDATRRTLILIFDPRSYFDELIRGQPDFELTNEAARQMIRYTQINKFIPTFIAHRMNDKSSVYVNQALSFLDEALTQRGHEVEQYDKFVATFSDRVPLNVHALLRNHVPDAIPSPPGRSFFDAIDQAKTGQANTTDAPSITPLADPFAENQVMSLRPEPKLTTSEGRPIQILSLSTDEDEDNVDEPTGPLTVNDRLRQAAADARSMPAVNVPVTSVPTPTPPPVTVPISRVTTESVTKSISLNQKFRFINQLFSGNALSYNTAMEELDKAENYAQALDLVSYRYAAQYLWDMSSDEVGELVEILKRRFAV